MPGPRDYSVGTDRALYELAQGTCYFPRCAERAIVFVEDVPVTNVHIAHVHGAKPGSARYDASMTDEQRASFANLLLLCKPHHDLVDRVKPDDYDADLLRRWKAEREGARADVLNVFRGLDERRFSEMLEEAVRGLRPQREVKLEVMGGVFVGHGLTMMPLDSYSRVVKNNEQNLVGERALVAIARNTGMLNASIDSYSIEFIDVDRARKHDPVLVGRNDYPMVNPTLPVPLSVGASVRWLTALGTIRSMVNGLAAASIVVDAFRFEAVLGSGETVDSDVYPVVSLPN